MLLPELIHGDSRTALPQLAAAGNAGTARLAYLDPPYNTQRSTRLGYRDYRTPATWSELITDVAAGCRELLREDGSLWLHINDRYAGRARMALDEVFGEGAYVGTVYWERTRSPAYKAPHLASTVDQLLIYAKDIAQLAPFTSGVSQPGKRVPVANRGNKMQDLVFPPGSVRFGVPDGVYEASNQSTASISATLVADVTVEGGRNANNLCLQLPSRYSAARVQQMVEDGDDFAAAKLPFRPSVAAAGGKPKLTNSLWSWALDGTPTHEDAAKEQAALALPGTEPFPWAKPVGLLRRIIELSTDPGDLVIDPFAGSGTTAAAAVQLGRRVIAIEERGELVNGLIARRVKLAATPPTP